MLSIKLIQEAVEAACDIVAMYLKDEGYSPKDDYTNLEKWEELENEDLSDCLKVANGLRNRLVYHYNGIDDSIAINSIIDVLPCLSRLSEVIEEWLKEEVAEDFQFLEDKVLAVLIFGSSTKEEGRDTDICIVALEGFDIKEVFKKVDVVGKKYDVWLFGELPLYMKMEVIENHDTLFCKDVPELYEYFYRFRKLWRDQERRNRLDRDEISSILGKS